ncbi:MAG: bifunctional phosphopantothenoylcysteine decarboxylase/phosphopantothenate--cysteine ligase CoaBC [Methylobacteriaceae bacterium]|nr:bifunctional phosphopantothenoylcysteine decarboxylase/phosphopantothenate--cysteine ligase CoaBC [Methylobacteriaceae bacterium]
MSKLAGKHVLLIVSGGIAAYKTLDLIRRLRERGAAVTPVLTKAAKQFVTPLSIASLSGRQVYDDLFSLTDETEMGHIQLSRASDLLLVAPATADLMAKAAHGLADDLASTLLLATDKTPIFAPAMNVRMWTHPATRRNLLALRSAGCVILGPSDGEMACGEFGPGRMLEPLEIVAALEGLISDSATSAPVLSSRPLAGRRAIVTAGPTREPIDPVRYISNKSSGKQGYAIAEALAAAGADTILVSGPVDLAAPRGVKVQCVESAVEMLESVRSALPADIFVSAAAVADWRVKNAGAQKTKKGPGGPPVIELVENPDILATISQMATGRPRLVVGFAAETENLVPNAQSKLARKRCDLIVANDVGAEQAIFGGDLNRVVIVDATSAEAWPQASKTEIAARIAALIADRLESKK